MLPNLSYDFMPILLQALESRDKHIESLEAKIKYLAEEMLSSTRLMNQLSAEKEDARNPNKSRACCKTIEESLQAANERCRELSEMLERSEEDNAFKSKQALQAISALDAYQRGEDGLVKALRKCTALEQKVISRDKQIRALIMELNSMHEIAHENGILRRRLNIPDDMVISAKNLVAKERNKEKIIERLTLKLRASEEMRLQLKLDKNDLRYKMQFLGKYLLFLITNLTTGRSCWSYKSNYKNPLKLWLKKIQLHWTACTILVKLAKLQTV